MRKTLFLELKKVAHLSERAQTSSGLNRMRRHRRINRRDFSDRGGMTSSVQAPVWITGSGWFRPDEWSRVSDWNQRHFPWMNILSWHRNTRCASPGQLDLSLKSTIRLLNSPRGWRIFLMLTPASGPFSAPHHSAFLESSRTVFT